MRPARCARRARILASLASATTGIRHVRHVTADDAGTVLNPLLTEIRIPRPAAAGWSFQKFTKRAIDWAIVGVAVQGGQVALMNMGPQPLRASAAERALAAGVPPGDAAAHAAEGTSPPTDLNGDPAFRAHLARVLVGRALTEAAARD